MTDEERAIVEASLGYLRRHLAETPGGGDSGRIPAAIEKLESAIAGGGPLTPPAGEEHADE